jgi:hypothetical protein
MKKFMLVFLCLGMMFSVAFASEQKPEAVDKWEISMMPKETPKEMERNKWSLILENNLGIYAYDNTSVRFVRDNKGKKNLNQVEADIKTVFVNKDTLKQIDAKYSKQLKKGDTTSYCLIHMIFNTANKTYTTTSMQVFSKKGKELDYKAEAAKFSPIPEKSFAEAMLEVVNQYVTENKSEMLLNKNIK